MLYGDYLPKVARRFESVFADIEAHHNFEYGPEFEIALCKVLRLVVPQRFGICRGYVVTADGTEVGDDIIIFNRERFGTLRLFEQDSFDEKQRVPVDTVCAYLEAKHTLSIDGDGGQSLQKAAAQVEAVKILPRAPVPPAQLTPLTNLNLDGIFTVTRPPGWPPIQNPIYGAVLARRVRLSDSAETTDDAHDIASAILRQSLPGTPPDLIVAGSNVFVMPILRLPKGNVFSSPHYVEGVSSLQAYTRPPGLAFAVGVSCLLYALDSMQLGGMPWQALLGDAMELKGVSLSDQSPPTPLPPTLPPE